MLKISGTEYGGIYESPPDRGGRSIEINEYSNPIEVIAIADPHQISLGKDNNSSQILLRAYEQMDHINYLVIGEGRMTLSSKPFNIQTIIEVEPGEDASLGTGELLRGQILIYPGVDLNSVTETGIEAATGFFSSLPQFMEQASAIRNPNSAAKLLQIGQNAHAEHLDKTLAEIWAKPLRNWLPTYEGYRASTFPQELSTPGKKLLTRGLSKVTSLDMHTLAYAAITVSRIETDEDGETSQDGSMDPNYTVEMVLVTNNHFYGMPRRGGFAQDRFDLTFQGNTYHRCRIDDLKAAATGKIETYVEEISPEGYYPLADIRNDLADKLVPTHRYQKRTDIVPSTEANLSEMIPAKGNAKTWIDDKIKRYDREKLELARAQRRAEIETRQREMEEQWRAAREAREADQFEQSGIDPTHVYGIENEELDFAGDDGNGWPDDAHDQAEKYARGLMDGENLESDLEP